MAFIHIDSEHSIRVSLANFLSLATFLSLQYFGDVRNRKRLVILSSLCIDTTLDLIFSMNGDIPHVPITTLAGIASLTDCKCTIISLMLLTEFKHLTFKPVCGKLSSTSLTV